MLYYYLISINLIALLLYCVDKKRAIKRKYRIPEKYLFLVAIVGGSVGSILGIYLFRHKTKRYNFTLGIPLLLVMQIVLYYSFIW